MKKAVVVLPAYNEGENIKTLIPAIFKYAKNSKNWTLSILIIDDESPDDTKTIVHTLQKKYNQLYRIVGKKKGLGNAYRRGFAYAIQRLHADYIFEMDADWQHDPSLIPLFLKQIDKGYDFVIGGRYMKGGSIPENWQFYRKFFSYMGNWVLRFGFMKFSICDWTSGYRAIKASFIKETLPIYKSFDGYTFQVALLDNAIKHGLLICEIPLKFADRKIGESKINTLNFVINNILYIMNHSSFFKYAVVGLIGASIDFGFSYIFIDIIKLPVWLSTAGSAELSIISNFILNNTWAFSHKKISLTTNTIVKSFSKFNLVAIGAIIIQSVFMEATTAFFGKKYWYIYKVIILACAVIPYSYFMYNRFIWKDKASKTN